MTKPTWDFTQLKLTDSEGVVYTFEDVNCTYCPDTDFDTYPNTGHRCEVMREQPSPRGYDHLRVEPKRCEAEAVTAGFNDRDGQVSYICAGCTLTWIGKFIENNDDHKIEGVIQLNGSEVTT